MKNTALKTRKDYDPYEVWQSPSDKCSGCEAQMDHHWTCSHYCHGDAWTWRVLKKWQVDDDKPYARWFCFVTSPYAPRGEMGDVYVSDIKSNAQCIFKTAVLS